MESLFYSTSISSKLHFNRPNLPRLPRFDSPRRLAPSSSSASSFPLLVCAESHRVNPLAANLQDPYFVSKKPIDECPQKSLSFSVDSASGFMELISQNLSERKVFNAMKLILVSAIFLTSLHPSLVFPAFASSSPAGTSLISSNLFSSAWTGFAAGCLHTLSGPDHLAALTPLSIGCSRMESAAVGALWGCGHDAGQVIFGLLFLLLKDRLHIEILSTWGTRVVGLTLLVIGAMGIMEASEAGAPIVALESGESDVSGVATTKKKIGFATFATGVVHGLQPDALIVILPALALPSRVAGAAFLTMFLVGTVIAMGSYTVFIGSCSQALKDRVPRITEKLTWASSFVAIALGLAILISQFFGVSLY
ncbi:hypothetical protein ACS0TY_004013 [Phlomoides rotata]